jgi:hypothetical protein
MLQDNDPLWNAIKDFLDRFEQDMNVHGGLISRETSTSADHLRLQLARDRAREAKAKAQPRIEALA